MTYEEASGFCLKRFGLKWSRVDLTRILPEIVISFGVKTTQDLEDMVSYRALYTVGDAHPQKPTFPMDLLGTCSPYSYSYHSR